MKKERHIPLDRRFASPSEEALRDPDYLSIWGSRHTDTQSWDEVLEAQRVVVLGEGKCGKTHEFKQQVLHLTKQGKFAFFVPLELLHDNDIGDVLSPEEESAFATWKSHDSATAFFFLDAVDELKLRSGSFRAALRKLRKSIGPRLARTKIVVSCRPRDWDAEVDLLDINMFAVPRSDQVQETPEDAGEKHLLSAITNTGEADETPETEKNAKQGTRVLALLPLSRQEMDTFAHLYAPSHADDLKRHFEEKELWHLYQSPADIMGALDQLIGDGQLGTLEEQLGFGIEQKLKEVSDKKRSSLSVDKAREGAERIALAMFLMKKRSILLDRAEEDGLDVGGVLSDWSREEQTELLGKALFDPTGVGAMRFHHRSTQEYLGARRLQKLRSAGLSTSALLQLLFGEVSDEKVIVPSMEPVVAWLALWNDDILKEVKERNPLLLFRQGLPASMSVELRADLLRRFIEQFSGSDWRRIGVGHPELKRVAHGELAPFVRELWDQAYSGHDTREILLELIWITPLPECADLAFDAAQDETLPENHRTYACWGVLNAGNVEQKEAIATSMLGGTWPERVVRNVISDLLPAAISADDFLTLACALTEIPRSVHGVGYSILNAVKSDKVSREDKITIRQRLTAEVWENRVSESKVYRAHSSYYHFTDPIIAGCLETVPVGDSETQDWAWSLTVAFHFGERQGSIVARDETKALQDLLKENISLREAYFWACFDLAEALEAPEDEWHRFWRSTDSRNMGSFSDADRHWLLKALEPTSIEERRGVAYYSLIQYFPVRESPDFIAAVNERISDRSDLVEVFERVLNPVERKPDKYDRRHQKWEKKQKKKEKKRVKQWLEWREEVLAAPDLLLAGDKRENTMYDAHKVIQQGRKDNSAWGGWDADLIANALSSEFLKRYREELSKHWRQQDIDLWSEREPEKRHTFLNGWLLALAGLKSEAETEAWAARLTPREAAHAVRISTVELNGFGSFVEDLETSHPSAVEQVVGQEVAAQLETLAGEHKAPILHDILYHGTPTMLKTAASTIASNLGCITPAMAESAHNDIEYAFKLLASHGDEETASAATDVIQQFLNASKSLEPEQIPFWVNALAKLDVSAACRQVLALTEDLSTEEQCENAITLFAAVFGDGHSGDNPSFDKIDNARRPHLLKELVIRAYQTVRPQDDVHHEGSYSPDRRDRAEEARGYLLNNLLGTKTAETLSVLYDLSDRVEFAHLKDRLKQMATEIAAEICEPIAMTATAFREFDQERNYVPYDEASLYAVMKSRLADFEHHLLEDEFTTVDTLRKIEGETELRRFISNWLQQNRRDAYSVNQEAVKVEENRTDIRLQGNLIEQYATIELKLDDTRHKWTGKDLEIALHDQLVGKYLSHERCHVGCLLICMRESRKWQNPYTKDKMDLDETVSWLQSIADKICIGRPELRISVAGIDYSKTD